MWLLLIGLAGLVPVDGAGGCPAPAAVAAALATLDADTAPPAAGHIELGGDDQWLRLRWRDAGGATLHEARLPRAGGCDELAEAAALVIAVWSGRADGGRAPRVPALPWEPPAAAVAARAPPRPSRAAYEVAAALLVGWEPGGAAAVGGSVEATVGPRAGRFAARLALSALSLQEQAFTTGRIAWTRPALSMGGRVRLGRGRLRFEASADLVAALLVLRGDGFASARQAYDFDPGLDAGVRLGVHTRWVTPFVDLRLVGWLRAQSAKVDGLFATEPLPRLDLWMSAGLAVGP